MVFSGQYLTYEEYSSLGGTISDEMPFNLLEFEARKRINNKTSNRLVNFEEQIQDVKLCVKALIDELVSYNNSGGNIKSKSVDGWSITYDKPVSKEETKKLNNIIDMYLTDCKLKDGTPYLYLG